MQKLAELCIRRPVFATMIVLALSLVGAVCFFTLGTDRFPNVDIPFVTVTTLNPGASPEEIEREVSDKIEAAVNTVSGIDELRSISSEGVSNVIVSFKLDKSGDIAAQEVRQQIDLIRNQLPKTAENPTVLKAAVGAAPVVMYAISSPSRSNLELSELADKVLVRGLQNVSGVGNVSLLGARKRQIKVDVDPVRLKSHSITIADVAAALRQQNLDLPGGSLDQGGSRLNVRTMGRVAEASAIEEITITTRDGYPLKIREVATVSDGPAEANSTAMLNGQAAVGLLVQKQSGINTISVIDGVRERMEELQPRLPKDVQLRMVRDQGEFIRNSLHDIEQHLLLGALLAAVVVYLFLRNWRSTIIAALAIPTSIVSAFGLMAALGYTLNMMTMLALTLMVGVVIDDAIVVLENIFRFIEEKGMSPWDAAIHGTREIGLAVMATTLSLLAVFIPIGFLGGIVGRFMSSFGFTSAAAIAVSLLVSFTLTPMLAARWLRKEDAAASHGQIVNGEKQGLNGWLDRHYTRILVWAMAHRWAMAGLCIAVIISMFPLFGFVGASFLPVEDENEFEIVMRLPEGASLIATQSTLERVARQMRQELPGVDSTFSLTANNVQGSPNAGSIFVRLVPATQRSLDQEALMMEARQRLKQLPKEINTAVQSVDPFGNGERVAAIMYILTGPDLQKLDFYSKKVVEFLKTNPKLVDVDRSLVVGKPEVRVRIDRDRAADLQVRVSDIAETLNTVLAGEKVSTFAQGKNQYDVVLRARRDLRRETDDVMSLAIPTATGGSVELRSVATLDRGSGPGTVDRLARERQVTLYANVVPGTSESEVLTQIQAFVDNLDMPPGYNPVLTGNSKELAKTGYYFLLACGLSFAFMYMVLAAQFESFLHPITILLTLPMSVPFGLISSWLAGYPLNIFSALGILLLFGVVKKNAILQIDHTNTLLAQGLPRDQAIIQANRDRLRPILMTTIALVAGMLPLLTGKGPGAATNASIAVLVVGGQTLCLLLTLLAVPVFYSIFDDASKINWMARFRAKMPKPQATQPGV